MTTASSPLSSKLGTLFELGGEMQVRAAPPLGPRPSCLQPFFFSPAQIEKSIRVHDNASLLAALYWVSDSIVNAH